MKDATIVNVWAPVEPGADRNELVASKIMGLNEALMRGRKELVAGFLVQFLPAGAGWDIEQFDTREPILGDFDDCHPSSQPIAPSSLRGPDQPML